jgi:DeoR/GlpR family transcriptional regulator of sugar metabolism
MQKTAQSGKQSEMPAYFFPVERRARLLQELGRNRKIVAAEVADAIGVSIDTIRRDLNELAAEGLVRRVHGGAVSFVHEQEPVAKRIGALTSAAWTAARSAARSIQAGQLVFFDGGSHIVAIAREVDPHVRFTAVTPALDVAESLANKTCETIVLGGSLLARERMTTGSQVVRELSRFRADLCFLGVCGLQPEIGLTTYTLAEAEVKQALIESSLERATILSAEKFNISAPFVVGPVGVLTRAWLLPECDREIARLLQRYGVFTEHPEEAEPQP